MICPAPITQITYLHPKVFIKLGSPLLSSFLLDLLLHVLRVEHFFVKVKWRNPFPDMLLSPTTIGCLSSLTLLELFAVKEKLVHLLLLLLHMSVVKLVMMSNLHSCLLEVNLLLQKLLPLNF